MAQAALDDAEFMALFEQLGGTELATRYGLNTRTVMRRRNTLERKYGTNLNAPGSQTVFLKHRERSPITVESGHVIIGSDLHLWPGSASTSLRALIQFCRDIKPKAVILNGDVLDFPQISAYPPIGWEGHPTVQQEIEYAQQCLAKIEDAAGKAHKEWTLGNHDARFEKRIATVAPEFAKIAGVHLKDHFPLWRASYSVWINDNTVVKHRFNGGAHATHNNVLKSGKNMVTGHLHSAKVTPYTDYNGTRYGVDTGCMADPDGAQFLYTEDNPKNWREAFAVLTFHKGKLLQPELVLVHDKNQVDFRGSLICV